MSNKNDGKTPAQAASAPPAQDEGTSSVWSFAALLAVLSAAVIVWALTG